MKIKKSFNELFRIIRENKEVSILYDDIQKANSTNQNDFYLKVLNFIKAILKTKSKNLDELYDDLYWFQYVFCEDELENEWEISNDVRELFFDFQKKPKPSVLIKKIESLEGKLKNPRD